MTSDLRKFAGTIAKLKHEHDAKDLGDKISLYEPQAKQSDKFLIKMEIRRLAQPVNRVIDLRNLLKKGCETTERGGIHHYLDNLALSDFDQELANYKNSYCLGVYEYVMERAKNRDEKAIVEASLPDPRFISLTRVHQRRDIRIYYSSLVQLFFDGPPEETKSLQITPDASAKTTDLSERGLSVKLTDPTLQLPHSMTVKFAGLEQEFLLNQRLFVKYNLLRQITRDGEAYAILTLDEKQDPQVLKACSELLKVCIHNQKRRNRVPVENTVDSIESKIREQYVLGRLAALPVLLSQADKKLTPAVILKSEDNAPLYAFLSLPEGDSLLPALYAHPLLHSGSANPNQMESYFLLRFRDKHKQLCFALIPFSDALTSNAIKKLLLRAFEQGGVRLINLHCVAIDALSGAHVPTSLPDSVGEAFENLNRGLHPKLKSALQGVTHLGVIKDMTSSVEDLSLKRCLEKENEQHNARLNLRDYLLNARAEYGQLFVSEVEVNESRQEDRFRVKMPLRIIGRKRDNKDKEFRATSSNVSTRGMHVVVDGDHPFVEGNELFVDMRVKIGDVNQVIKNQRYRVVKKHGPELWLAVTGDLTSHDARIFLRKTINANLGTLLAVGSNDQIYGLSRATRNIYASNHPTLYGLVRKDEHGTLIRSLIRSERHLPIRFHSLIAEPIGLKQLVKNEAFRKRVESSSKLLSDKSTSTAFHICVVARKKRQSSEVSLIVKPFGEQEQQQSGEFIFNSLKSFGEPVVLRVTLSSKGKVFDKYFRDEMRYLLRYAKLKHQECIEIQDSATSILEVEDITPMFTQCLENF